jgi:hypothetical protein
MSEVERGWFAAFAGADVSTIYYTDDEPDADFDGVRDADVKADFATFRAEVDSARRLVRDRSLDDTEVIHGGTEFSLRWIMVHLIEEYARHNGHADLLRERIDGVTGVFPG